MTRRHKLGAAAAAALLLGTGLFGLLCPQPTIQLELGMFAGSNWGVANANSYAIIDRAISLFEQQHPGVTVSYDSGILKEDYSEWFARKLLAGGTPDVFMVLSGDFNTLTQLGALKNLDELIQADPAFDPATYFPSGLQAGQRFSTQYALPFEIVPTLMFVNKSLLLKEGIQVPQSHWTWQDLYQICKQVTKDTDQNGVLDQFGTYNYTWRNMAATNGVQLFDPGGTRPNFLDPQLAEAVYFSKKIYDLNQGQKVTAEDFDNGKVAFMPLSFAEYRTYKTYPYKIKKFTNFQWDCITLPAGESGDNTSEVDALLMAIGKHTRHPDLAWELLKTLTYSQEIQMDIFRFSQGASPLKAVTGSPQVGQILGDGAEAGEQIVDQQLLIRVIEQGMVIPKFQKYEQAMAIAENEISTAFQQDKSIDRTLKYVQRAVGSYLAQ